MIFIIIYIKIHRFIPKILKGTDVATKKARPHRHVNIGMYFLIRKTVKCKLKLNQQPESYQPVHRY